MKIGEEIRVISSTDVEKVMPMKDAVKFAEDGIIADAQGRVLGDKFYMEMERGFVKPFSGYIEGNEYFFVKEFTLYVNNPTRYNLHSSLGMVIIHDSETGTPVCIMEPTYATALRTGASTPITAKYLANADSKILAIFGAGTLGRTHVEGLNQVFDLEEIRVVDPIKEVRENFVNEMSKKIGKDIEPVESAHEAIKNADIVITVTTANEPIIRKDWFHQGLFLAKLGSYQEIDTEIVLSVDKFVVDKWEYTAKRVPELKELTEKGLLTEESVYAEYPEIVSGRKPGRESPEEKILYIALGLWGEYASILPEIYRRASNENLGTVIKFKG